MKLSKNDEEQQMDDVFAKNKNNKVNPAQMQTAEPFATNNPDQGDGDRLLSQDDPSINDSSMKPLAWGAREQELKQREHMYIHK